MTDDGDDGDWGEEQTYFTGTCICLPSCPNYGNDAGHGWGSCDGDGCACEAGWEE